jgi:hypothetical protein
MDEARGIVAAAVGETIATERVSDGTEDRAMRAGAWDVVCVVGTAAAGLERLRMFPGLTRK